MAEREELIQRSNSRKDYGSVRRDSNVSEHKDKDHYDDDDYGRPVRCLCTRRDTILISIVSVFIIATITASLAVGIPKIQEKERRLLETGSLTPLPPLPPLPNIGNENTSPNPAAVKTTAYVSAPVDTDPPLVLSTDIPSQAPPAAANTDSQQPANTDSTPAQQEARFKRAAVSADDQRCAQIGSNLLRQNGSAVDAAIGTLTCLEAVNPQHSGIAGGFFMTIYSREQRQGFVIDAREVAPAGATWNMFQGNANHSATGGLSVAVPGTVRGYWEAHQKFGKLPWKSLFEPTITFCRQGYRVGRTLAMAIEKARDTIMREETLRDIFVNNATNDIIRENFTLVRLGFANTLQTIAEQGATGFYEGILAEQLVADIAAKGGILTLSDLANYKVIHKAPLSFQGFGSGLQALSVPPPGAGPVIALILNIMAGYNTTTFNATDVHHLVEAFKFAYAKRTELGDEDFVNVTQLVQNMTSPEFAASLRRLIRNNQTFSPDFYGPKGLTSPPDQGTSHVSVIAPNGDAVAVTSTINTRFGAKFRSRSLDVILNDEMDDFSSPNITNFFDVAPSLANAIQPGKRPLSSMAPTIILKDTGDAVLVIGAAGGIVIPTSITNVLVRHLFAHLTLPDAVASPRVHHQLFPNLLQAESTFPRDILNALAGFGHNLSVSPLPETHVNAILKQQDGSYFAVSDSRIESGTDGF